MRDAQTEKNKETTYYLTQQSYFNPRYFRYFI